MPMGPTTPDAQIATLGQRVAGVEAAVDGIRKDIHSLVNKFDEKSAFPWGAASFALASVGVMGAVVVWAFSAYVNQIQVSQESADRRIELLASVVVPRAELEDRRIVSSERTSRIEADIIDIRSSIVPRGEHEERWRSTEARDSELKEQIDDLEANVAAMYTPGRAFSDIMERLDRLERFRLLDNSSRRPME